MIYKGLNTEDADFLGMVSQKQAEIDDRRYNEESEELINYRVCFSFRKTFFKSPIIFSFQISGS